jgi:hypothetical protein
MKVIYYYPGNRYEFKGQKVRTSNLHFNMQQDSKTPQKIRLVAGRNEISDEEAEYISDNMNFFETYFKEGSLVFEEEITNKNLIEKPSKDKDNLDEIIKAINDAGTLEEVQNIIQGEKRKAILEAAKVKLDQIKSASV